MRRSRAAFRHTPRRAWRPQLECNRTGAYNVLLGDPRDPSHGGDEPRRQHDRPWRLREMAKFVFRSHRMWRCMGSIGALAPGSGLQGAAKGNALAENASIRILPPQYPLLNAAA